ncbi:hypothetical protein GYM75_09745 [Gilliamella sp. ESL0441]|uniref:hypothetical protein n=1 Tax=Gilliamella sp. ESL0441 TaxID=2704654 RepID=UPI001C69F284|nr:hypothetical protein [Gilliamella sp. ESL0441]QYN45104.1 hypothetical protein GYM75_09745 [Gilliamella sp. ESL0441]
MICNQQTLWIIKSLKFIKEIKNEEIYLSLLFSKLIVIGYLSGSIKKFSRTYFAFYVVVPFLPIVRERTTTSTKETRTARKAGKAEKNTDFFKKIRKTSLSY